MRKPEPSSAVRDQAPNSAHSASTHPATASPLSPRPLSHRGTRLPAEPRSPWHRGPHPASTMTAAVGTGDCSLLVFQAPYGAHATSVWPPQGLADRRYGTPLPLCSLPHTTERALPLESDPGQIPVSMCHQSSEMSTRSLPDLRGQGQYRCPPLGAGTGFQDGGKGHKEPDLMPGTRKRTRIANCLISAQGQQLRRGPPLPLGGPACNQADQQEGADTYTQAASENLAPPPAARRPSPRGHTAPQSLLYPPR